MLSLIVLTYNDPRRLRLCLHSLLRQTTADFELVVVNDGGDRAINQPVYEEMRRQGREVAEIWFGPETTDFRAAAARNEGLKRVHGERVLFLDGDCVLAPNVVAEHEAYKEEKVLVNGARKRIPEACLEWLQPENFGQLEQHVFKRDARYDLHGPQYEELSVRLEKGETVIPLTFPQVWSFQLSVPTSLAREIGGFNEEFVGYGGEDEEFAARMTQIGVSLLGRFDLISYHLEHPSRKPAGWPWKRRIWESLKRFGSNPLRNGGVLPGPNDSCARPSGLTVSK